MNDYEAKVRSRLESCTGVSFPQPAAHLTVFLCSSPPGRTASRLSGFPNSCSFLQVFTANNVNVVTRIRTEHLTEEEKRRYKGGCLAESN